MAGKADLCPPPLCMCTGHHAFPIFSYFGFVPCSRCFTCTGWKVRVHHHIFLTSLMLFVAQSRPLVKIGYPEEDCKKEDETMRREVYSSQVPWKCLKT